MLKRTYEGSYIEVQSVPFLGTFTKLRKATIIFVMSVCASAWNNSVPTGRIFVKLDTGVFF